MVIKRIRNIMNAIKETSTKLLIEDIKIYEDIKKLGLLTNQDKRDRLIVKKELERRNKLQK